MFPSVATKKGQLSENPYVIARADVMVQLGMQKASVSEAQLNELWYLIKCESHMYICLLSFCARVVSEVYVSAKSVVSAKGVDDVKCVDEV